jgi:hypothetical protein
MSAAVWLRHYACVFFAAAILKKQIDSIYDANALLQLAYLKPRNAPKDSRFE